MENGKPLEGASVACTPEGRPYWRKNLTNGEGIVSFASMDKVGYIVDADISSTHPLANAGYRRSQWIRVAPGSGTTNVRLVFRKH